jgi:hypothetical protein
MKILFGIGISASLGISLTPDNGQIRVKRTLPKDIELIDVSKYSTT